MMKRIPPMAPERRQEIALQMHAAVTSLLHEPDDAVANNITRLFAIMVAAFDQSGTIPIIKRTDAASKAIMAAHYALCAMCERHGRLGRWGVSGEESIAIRDAITYLDRALSQITWPAYLASQQFVDANLSKKAA